MSKDTSVCLTIHNQEPIIDKVVRGICSNISENVKEIIIVFDGCTDNTEQVVKNTLSEYMTNPQISLWYLDNVWETKANNFSFQKSTCPWIITVQDDMVINEKYFDQRLMKPFIVVDNVLGVTARNAQDEKVVGNELHCYNVAGKDVNSPRNLFAVRGVAVRGPIMFNHDKLATLGYLDESFAPLDSDDKDLSIRAYKKYGWLVGSYVIDYDSPLSWGKTRNNFESNRIWAASATKNIKMLIERHGDFLMGEIHSQNFIID